jgi:glycosyltransferase involved in cell wall biosynthesis
MLQKQLRAWTNEPILVIPIDHSKGRIRKLIDLTLNGLLRSRSSTVIFLTEFNVQYAVLAWIVAKARGAVLVVDHFVGTYETHVLDHKSVAPDSWRAGYFRAVDKLAYFLADVVTIDTEFRARALDEALAPHRKNSKTFALPVGAPDWAKSLTATADLRSDRVLRVLFYGNYLPLHGVDYVVEEIASLPSGTPVVLTIVGTSPDRARVEGKARALGLTDNCIFLDSVSEFTLSKLIERHHVVLGIFGTTAKAESVIANKVWQGLYAGRTVITRESPALGELRPLVSTQLRSVSTLKPAGLRDVLLDLAGDPSAVLISPATQLLDAHVESAHQTLFVALSIQRREDR